MSRPDRVMLNERAKYDDVWQTEAYRVKAHGLAMWCDHREWFPETVYTALDLGCGHGRLFAHWNEADGIDGHGVDFSEHALDGDIAAAWGHKFHLHCLWDFWLGRRFDLGVCADVMEHIPEDRVAPTLERIGLHCREVVFKIANHPSHYLGHDLHPTRREADWWEAQIEQAGGAVERLPYDALRSNYVFRWQP